MKTTIKKLTEQNNDNVKPAKNNNIPKGMNDYPDERGTTTMEEHNEIEEHNETAPTNSIRIGEVFLESRELDMRTLISLTLGVLEHPALKSYLGILKVEKKLKGASYIE